MLTLAGEMISSDHALAHLRAYGHKYTATIRYYDHGGDLSRPPGPSDGVDMSDIARLVIINANLQANDVPRLLAPVPDGLWRAVPHDTGFEDLPDNPVAHPTYRALQALYDAYGGPSLRLAKVTKLLHLKRPGLVAVIDSVSERTYRHLAETAAKECGEGRRLFWVPMWRDARANAAEVERLRRALRQDGKRSTLVAALPPLRLHDILIWSHFAPRGGCVIPD